MLLKSSYQLYFFSLVFLCFLMLSALAIIAMTFLDLTAWTPITVSSTHSKSFLLYEYKQAEIDKVSLSCLFHFVLILDSCVLSVEIRFKLECESYNRNHSFSIILMKRSTCEKSHWLMKRCGVIHFQGLSYLVTLSAGRAYSLQIQCTLIKEKLLRSSDFRSSGASVSAQTSFKLYPDVFSVLGHTVHWSALFLQV